MSHADDDAGPSEGGDGRSVRAQQRREQRRSEILAAATRVFCDKGYHAASVNDIIDAAEIARGTFYLYFNGKREIFTELTTEFLGVIRGSVRTISLESSAPHPVEQMRANFRRVMSAVIAHEDLATIMLREGGDLDAEARALMDQFFAQIITLIQLAVRVGRSLGLARECDDRIIAVSALGALREVLSRMLTARRAARGRGAAESAAPAKAPVNAPADASAKPASGLANDPASGLANDPAHDLAHDLAHDPAHDLAHDPAHDPAHDLTRGLANDPAEAMTDTERLADELVTFFVRGVFT